MRVLIFFLFTLMVCISAFAKVDTLGQVTQPNRYELKQKISDNYFTIISLEEEGIALFRELDKYKDGKRSYQLILLDKDLKERHDVELEFDNKNVSMGYEYASGTLFLLFRKGNSNKNELELAKINLQDATLESFAFKPDIDIKITHFGVINTSVFFGGYVVNEPSVFLYNFKEDQIVMLPGFYQKDNDLIDIRSNHNNTFNVVLFDRGIKENPKLIFRTFDESGKQLLEDVIPVSFDYTIHSALTSSLEREDLAIIGCWGYRGSKQSNGFFFISVNPFAEQEIQYSYLGQLDQYLDYIKPKRAKKLQAKTETELKEGREVSLGNHIMPFRVFESKNGFMVLAEVYTPSSGTNYFPNNPYDPGYINPYSYSPYWPGYYYPGMGRMYSRYQNGRYITEDDEAIRLHETVVIAYDAQGKIIADYSVPLDDVKMPTLEQFSDFYSMDSNLSFLVYKKEEELIVTTFDVDEAEKKEARYKIKLTNDFDEFRSERKKDGGVKIWFENVFYTWGYQTIRNINEEDRVRDVFYINKVVIEK